MVEGSNKRQGFDARVGSSVLVGARVAMAVHACARGSFQGGGGTLVHANVFHWVVDIGCLYRPSKLTVETGPTQPLPL